MKNTLEERVELIKAANEGRTIEFTSLKSTTWMVKECLDYWDFRNTAYRIKPQTFDAYLCDGGICSACLICGETPCTTAKRVKLQVIEND
ncbi:MAG: hypothetical protein GY938_11355 [Ketobacter sp.]|nr:hypothetical protein [Ketobacter sp.]